MNYNYSCSCYLFWFTAPSNLSSASFFMSWWWGRMVFKRTQVRSTKLRRWHEGIGRDMSGWIHTGCLFGDSKEILLRFTNKQTGGSSCCLPWRHPRACSLPRWACSNTLGGKSEQREFTWGALKCLLSASLHSANRLSHTQEKKQNAAVYLKYGILYLTQWMLDCINVNRKCFYLKEDLFC